MKRVMCLLESYEVGCEMTPGMFLALGWAAGQDVNEIQGVVGLIAAIYAWREWQLVGQREYIRIELQGMLARQTRYLHELEARLISS